MRTAIILLADYMSLALPRMARQEANPGGLGTGRRWHIVWNVLLGALLVSYFVHSCNTLSYLYVLKVQ